MKNIEVALLNPEQLNESEKYMVAMARMTQRGHSITNMVDFMELLDKSYTASTVTTMASLPHPTIQKFGLLNIAIVGASRRFLAQITRHQNEVKFMSGSLQYSDYSDAAQFVVPYEVTRVNHSYNEDPENRSIYGKDYIKQQYLNSCLQSFDDYKKAVPLIGHDAAGYQMPQGMRNVLLMSVLPFELKHIISQRVCNRNTLETQYVMLKIWELVYDWPMFKDCGAPCAIYKCLEGKFSCGHGYKGMTPTEILHQQFPLLYEEED